MLLLFFCTFNTIPISPPSTLFGPYRSTRRVDTVKPVVIGEPTQYNKS